MKIIKKLRFSRMFIPIVIIALFLGTVSVGAGVATVLNLTSTSEETVEPIVYTLDNQEMIDKIATHAYTVKSFENGYLKMSTVQADGYGAPGRFTLQPSWSTLGDAFEVQGRSYFKVNYILDGTPEDETSFEVNISITHDNAGTSVSSYSWITIDKAKHGFENGDELEIIVDMAKKGTSTNGQYALVSDAVWVRNVTDAGEYVQVNSYASATDYQGDIVSADLQLATTSAHCLTRTAYVKYFGFFATLAEAQEYPLEAEIAKLQANNTKTIDGSHKTKGHAIEAAEAYIDSFGFTTNPEVQVGDFTAPTETTEGSYVFDVVFKNQTTVTVTMTIEKVVEPIVYKLDNQDIINKIATHAYTVKSFENGYLKMSTVQAEGYGAQGRFTLQPSWSTLGDAFEVQSRRYFKVNYILDGMPTDETSFEVNLTITHDNDGTSVSSYSWITIDKTTHGFENGDELEIIVDMAKKGTSTNGQYALVSDAIWVRNVTDGGEYVQVNSYASATDYQGDIVSADIQLGTTKAQCLTRIAYVKYFGFFNNLDVAKSYDPNAEEVVTPTIEAYILDEAEHPTWDDSIITKGHAIEAAQAYIDSFNFTTNPVVKEGTFTAPTAETTGSYVFDVVFGSGTDKETTITVTITIEKVVDPIVYTFDNAGMVAKIDSYGNMKYSFEENSLRMQALAANDYAFTIRSTYTDSSGLGDAFEVGDRRYLKIDYTLSGVPTDATTFQVDLILKHGDPNKTSEAWFNLNCTALSFENGDELEIIVDMAKRGDVIAGQTYGILSDAVWVRNVTDNTEYIQVDTYFYDTVYTGDITYIDFRLCSVGGTDRIAYVKYLGFFNDLDVAKLYPNKEPVSPLVEAYILEDAKTIIRDGSVNTKALAIAEAKAYIDSFGFTTNPVVQEGTFTAPTTQSEGSYVFDVIFGTTDSKTVTVTMTIKKVIEPIVYTLDNADILSKLDSHYYTVLSLENGYVKMQTRTGDAGYTNASGLALTPNWPKLGDAFDVEDKRFLKFDYKLSGLPDGQDQFGVNLYVTHGDASTSSAVEFSVSRTTHSFENGDELEIIVDMSTRNTTDDAVWIKNVTKGTEYIASPLTYHNDTNYEGEIVKADFRLGVINGVERTAYVQYFGFFDTLAAAKNYNGATVAQQRLEVMAQELQGLLDTLSIEWGDGNTEEKALSSATALIGEAGIGAELAITGYTPSTEDSEGSVYFSTTLVSGGQTANVDGLAIKIDKVPESIVWRFNTQELKNNLELDRDTTASIDNHHLKLERTSATATNNLGFTVETPADAEQFYLQSYPYIVMKYKRHGVGPFQIYYSTDIYKDARFINTYIGIGPEEDQWYTSIIDTTVKDREAPIVWNFNHDDASKNWNYRHPTMVALNPIDNFKGLTEKFYFAFNTFRQENATVELEYIAFFPTMEAALKYKNANEIESLKSNAKAALENYAGESIFYEDGDDEATAKAKAIIESKLGTELMEKVEVTITDGSYVEPNADSEGSYTFTASVTKKDDQTELYVKSNVTLTFLDLNDFQAELNAITDITEATCYHSDALTEEGAEHTAKKMIAKKMLESQIEGVEIVDVNCETLEPSTMETEGHFTCEVTLGYGDVTATYTKTVRVTATVNTMPKEPIIIDADDKRNLLSGSLNISTKDGNIHTESLETPKSDEYFWIGDQVTPWFYLPDYPYFSMKLNRTVDSGDSMGNSQIYFWNTETTGAPAVNVELGGIDMNGKWVSTVINMRDGSATLYDMETSSVYSTKAATGNLVGSGYDGLLTRLRITTSRDITAKRVTDIEYIGFFPTAEMVEEYMKGILVDGFHSFNGAEHAVAEDALDAAPRTLEAVVRIESEKLGSAMTIISNKESAEDTDYFALETTEDGNVKLIYGGQEITTTDENVYTGEWVYIAAVVGDSEATIYITNSIGETSETTGTISANASEGLLVKPVVGGDYTADNNFVGDIANVELYSTAKADIIFSDYKLPADPKAGDVIACWPMSKLSVENTYEDIHGTNTLTLKDSKGIAGHEFTGYDYVKTEDALAGELKTFESLIKISESQLTGTYTLISNETTYSADHFSIQLVDGEIQVEYNSDEEKVLTTSGLNLTPGKWTHVALTFDSTPALYIDGTLFSDDVTTVAVEEGVSLDKLYIGVCPEDIKETAPGALDPAKPENAFVGHMSDVRLWSTVLPADEIGETLEVSEELLSAWMLDKQTYLEYDDASNNENTGTLYSNGWYKLENLTYDYTIMHVADTQNLLGYNKEDQYYEMMSWIAKNKEKMNTQFLFHLGDVTQVNSMYEWKMAKKGFDMIDAVKLPYTIVLGNHDYPTPTHGIGTEFRDESNFNATFPYEDYFTNDEDVTDKGAFEEGNSINVYKCFDVTTDNGEVIKYIVLALEFGPRDEVLDWASGVLEEHADRKAFITTHAYQDTTGRLATFDIQRYGGDFKDGNEGIDVWNKLVSKHDNIVMVNCGHAQGKSTKHLMKNNDAGKGVVQILADPSAMMGSGDFNTTTSYGIFMIMAFTDEGKMHTYYYSPIKNMYWDTANEYTYNMFTDNGVECVQEKGQKLEDAESSDGDAQETFTYLVSADAGNDKAIINLPKNYSAAGEPVKLVIYNRGAGTSLEESPNSSLNNELLEAGYATLHVRGIPEAYQNSKYIWGDYGVPYGSPVFIDSVIAAYEYITENYNIDTNGCAVFGASAGGLQSLNLVNHAADILPIKSVLLDAPVVDLYNDCYFNGDWRTGTLNGYTAAGVAWMYQFEHCDFENGTYTVGENTYSFSDRDTESLKELWELNVAKVQGYNPYEISLSVPVQMWFGSRETVNNVDFGRQFIESCKNGGVSAEFVSVDTDKHVIYANHPEYCIDMVKWINAQ